MCRGRRSSRAHYCGYGGGPCRSAPVRARGPVQRGIRPPGDAGGGLPGTHPGGRRVQGGRGGGGIMVALGTRRPDRSAGRRDRVARVLRAEWTKFRTVRGWVLTTLVAAALPTGFALLNMGQCTGCLAPLTGPGGETVTGQVSVVARTLAGD